MKTIYVKNVARKLLQTERINWKKAVPALALFAAMFFLGREAAQIRAEARQASGRLLQETEDWGLGFGSEGEKPTGNATAAELAGYDAYYCGQGEEKVIYLTFDAGYENGCTAQILDVLKKHQAPAAFFLVGSYIREHGDLVQRMAAEGHIVGNHTDTHPDMSAIADQEAFAAELAAVEAAYQEAVGEDLPRFYRPPQGKYSEANLQQAKQLGYHTVFWSLAYVDWNTDDQPSREEAFGKLLPRVHNGAIVLLHSTSETNAKILDELLSEWEKQGFCFKRLDELPGLTD